MSWARAYHLALWLLPPALRLKHGSAMEALFARGLTRAYARGPLHGALAGAAGVWDLIRRGAYEHLRPAGAGFGGEMSPLPDTRQLLRRLASTFVIAFAIFTAVLLALHASRQVPALSARGVPTRTMVEALLLAIPFIAAMTIPMAVLAAVLCELILRTNGEPAIARSQRHDVRRLVVPVLAAAAGVAVLTLVVTAEIVPRTNARLTAVLAGRTDQKSDREMTIGELRAAVRNARDADASAVAVRRAAYEVEIQKKLALSAACIVMALIGVAVALRAPRGGAALVIVASCAVFGAYYVLLITGEGLADRMVVSPFVGMWGANLLLLAAALLALRRPRTAPLEPADAL